MFKYIFDVVAGSGCVGRILCNIPLRAVLAVQPIRASLPNNGVFRHANSATYANRKGKLTALGDSNMEYI